MRQSLAHLLSGLTVSVATVAVEMLAQAVVGLPFLAVLARGVEPRRRATMGNIATEALDILEGRPSLRT